MSGTTASAIRRLSIWRAAAWIIALVGGVAAEAAAGALRDPSLWIADLTVGMAFVSAGLLSPGRILGGAPALLLLTGVAWFVGTAIPVAIYLHRGVLVLVFLAFPGWRPRSSPMAGVVAGAVAALAVLGGSDAGTVALCAVLLAVAGIGHARATRRARIHARVALQASLAFATVLLGSQLVRAVVPRGDGVYPALLLYETGLVAIALFLALHLRRPAGAAVADLVVELGGDVSGTLRDRLSALLGDPSLEVGYRTGDGYVAPDGTPVDVPRSGADRSSTLVSLDGRPFAVIVHDAAVLRDPPSVEAVTRATRLSTSNVQLRSRVATAVADIEASSRRLVLAADAERDRLAIQLASGPERTLAGVARSLAALTLEAGDGRAAHLARSKIHIDTALRDLHEVGRGLRPAELEVRSFREVLEALASRTPLPVEVHVGVEDLPAEIRTAVYYLCAEALSNVAKYAEARLARIRLAREGDRLVVEIDDDGRGGADASRGTGLAGMQHRVETIGGTLAISSLPNMGTRLVAGIPLGDEAR